MSKAPFSLHKRLSSKREQARHNQEKRYLYISYAQFRDEDGRYTTAISTGERRKADAMEWCLSHLNQSKSREHRVSFQEYSASWWKPDLCIYLRERARTGHRLSDRYIKGSRQNLENHILPHFGNLHLDAISAYAIRQFMYDLTEKKNLSPATSNRILATLKVMMKGAISRGLIHPNPTENVGVYKEEKLQRELLTIQEAHSLLSPQNTLDVWRDDMQIYTLNLLAATTGLRLREIQGLTITNVKGCCSCCIRFCAYH